MKPETIHEKFLQVRVLKDLKNMEEHLQETGKGWAAAYKATKIHLETTSKLLQKNLTKQMRIRFACEILKQTRTLTCGNENGSFRFTKQRSTGSVVF